MEEKEYVLGVDGGESVKAERRADPNAQWLSVKSYPKELVTGLDYPSD